MAVPTSPSVLIVRLDAIGDALTTVPLVSALRSHGMRVGAVLTERNAGVFAPGALARVHIDADGIAAEVARARYDVALIPSEEPHAYELARDAAIPMRIGFDNGLLGKPLKTLWIRRVCTRTVFREAGLDRRGLHECEIVFQLARDLLPGAASPRDPAELRPLVLDTDVARTHGAAMQITAKWLQLGASLEEVCRLATLLSADGPLRLFGAASERAFIDDFCTRTSLTVERFPTMEPWKTAIARSAALVAPDSGATHVAGMTGTPVVACFSAASFALQTARWKPWAAPCSLISIERGWSDRATEALRELTRVSAANA